MQDRFRIHYEEKRKICDKACSIVQEGECIFGLEERVLFL